MHVILLGMKHCGKSTVGAGLAARWGCAFYDVDAMIEERHACEGGVRQTVREVYSDLGEATFDRLECAVVCELCLTLERLESRAVVAMGGRTAVKGQARRLLDGLGLMVYLQVPVSVLYDRVMAGGLPPFLAGSDSRVAFEALCRAREPRYLAMADVTVDLAGLDRAGALAKVIGSIEERWDERQ